MAKRTAGQPIRVLVVEDSPAQRELLIKLVQSSPGFILAGMASNGRDAVAAAQRLRPDVIAMDINLPILDGYEATRQIMQRCPTPIVMISSNIDDAKRRSVEALAAGALTVVGKPGSLTDPKQAGDRESFMTTLRLMADVLVVTRHPPRTPPPSTVLPTEAPRYPRVLAIAASTGGPAAVQALLSGLGSDFPLPIVLAQHIARGFVNALVDWLNSTVSLKVRIATQQEQLVPGNVYLPSDDHHILMIAPGIVTVQPTARSDRYCPSADKMFESVARVYGARAIGVILTGMGDDGVRGLQQLYKVGGRVIAQDKASCVVYGMPQAAVAAGVVTQVEPLSNIAETISFYLQRQQDVI